MANPSPLPSAAKLSSILLATLLILLSAGPTLPAAAAPDGSAASPDHAALAWEWLVDHLTGISQLLGFSEQPAQPPSPPGEASAPTPPLPAQPTDIGGGIDVDGLGVGIDSDGIGGGIDVDG